MAIHKSKNHGKGGRTSKQFKGDGFELGRGGESWFDSSRPKEPSWCSGGGKKKGKKKKEY